MHATHVGSQKLVIPVCREMCPAGVDVPRHLRCIQACKFDEALAVLRERIPFPSVCGYACYSPCESKCGHQQFGDPIAIRAMHRAAAENGGDSWKQNLSIAAASGKRIAVVGSGPCGLTAAYYLATCGHAVTVFESLSKPGGMLRVGIPAYRLSKTVLDQEIEVLRDIGVEIKTDCKVQSAQQLRREDYDAVLLAVGAQKGARLGIPGEELPGVLDGIAFLLRVNQGQNVDLGRRIAIIGGGNSAVDAARSAVRLGATEITVIYRRTEAQMTAYAEEVEAAVCEGVRFEFLAIPIGIENKNGSLETTLARMQLGKPDASGRPQPVQLENSRFVETYDTVITAVGQTVDLSPGMDLNLNARNLIETDVETLATDTVGVFAGGDVVKGPASIIDAIAHGRKAASGIDKFLGGSGIIDQELAPPQKEVLLPPGERQADQRAEMPLLDLTERLVCFEQVERGFNQDQSREEAQRCLSCDARTFEVVVYPENCKECGYCREVCQLDIFQPANHFNTKGYRPLEAQHTHRCVGCLQCFYACPDFAIDVTAATDAR